MKEDVKKHSIVIIGVYYGKFPKYIDLFFKSCEMNPTIDWFIYTDQKVDEHPMNVRIISSDIADARKRASKVLGMQAALTHPYKLCDFKTIYGLMWAEDIDKYEFWGHCDFDMIFGDLRKFFTNEILDRFDKLLRHGHLTLFRNTEEVNNVYKLDGGKINYIDAFVKTSIVTSFDELAINSIFIENYYPIYIGRNFLDISSIYKKFRIIQLENYKKQTFFWENGKVIHAYIDNNQQKEKEYLYIHFKKRKFYDNHYDIKNTRAFFIGPDGLSDKKLGVLNTEDYDKYNPDSGILVEYYEQIIHQKEVIFKKIKNKLGIKPKPYELRKKGHL